MPNNILLLSIKELAQEPPESGLWRQVYDRLDEERLEKVKALRNPEKRAASAGGGLLLQRALQRAKAGETSGLAAFACKELALPELVAELGEPLSVRYSYGDRGKPYVSGGEVFFNLSHSGDYVLCAVAGQEIGVDIQKMCSGREERVADRFFSREEREMLRVCDNCEERQARFYQLWTRKEAYGKLTGEGIVSTIGKDFRSLEAEWIKNVFWEEFDTPPGYKIACCTWRAI